MAQSWNSWCWKLGLVSSLTMGGAIALSRDCTLAQPIPDETLGAENSVVTPNMNIDGIPSDRLDGGARRGANLFHSFREFNIDEGRGAYFTNPAGVENILSQVTGSNPSNIKGTLGVLGNANLFLINPNGIIFGSNASLDVRGSFVATTANAVRLGETGLFSASEPAKNNLLTVRPSALFFNTVTAQAIVNQSQAQSSIGQPSSISTSVGLQVPSNQTLALIGGDVVLLGGNLTAAGGSIELGSVAGLGEVSWSQSGNSWKFGYERVDAFKNISLDGGLIDASGETGGNIRIQGDRLQLNQRARIYADTTGKGAGGEIFIHTNKAIALSGGSRITTDVSTGVGTGGNVTIETGQLSIQDRSLIRASTFIQGGKAGNLTVTASDSVELVGGSISTQSAGTGDAGDIILTTGRLIVRDRAFISTGPDKSSKGKGGNLSVTASDSVEVVGSSALSTQTQSAGAAGELTLSTKQLSIRDGSFVSASTLGAGKGGNLSVTASDSVELAGRSGLFVSSFSGLGDAGNLQLTARSIRLDNQGVITAQTDSGQGGDIKLQVQDLLLLRRGSNISTNAGTTGTSGDGGNINIDTDLLAAFENSNITADAVVGKGGNVRISTEGLFLSSDSKITAKSDRGIDGVVEINRADIDPSAELVVLPAELVDVSGLIAQGCSAGGSNVASGESKFIVTGRGGLPPTPRDTLSSETVLEDWGNFAVASWQPLRSQQRPESQSPSPAATLHTHLAPAPIVEAQGWVIGDNGNVVLTANASTETSHRPWLNPAACHGN